MTRPVAACAACRICNHVSSSRGRLGVLSFSLVKCFVVNNARKIWRDAATPSGSSRELIVAGHHAAFRIQCRCSTETERLGPRLAGPKFDLGVVTQPQFEDEQWSEDDQGCVERRTQSGARTDDDGLLGQYFRSSGCKLGFPSSPKQIFDLD